MKICLLLLKESEYILFVKVSREASGVSDLHGEIGRHLCHALRQLAQNLSGDHRDADKNKVLSTFQQIFNFSF